MQGTAIARSLCVPLVSSIRASLLAVAALAALASATADASPGHDGHAHFFADQLATRSARDAGWRSAGGWRIAPPHAPVEGGTRVAALLQVADAGAPLALEARGVDGAEVGPWRRLDETFRGPEHRVAVAELGARWPAAELRIAAADSIRAGDVSWELLVPRFPDAGRLARAAENARRADGASFALDPTLGIIGVVSREQWGARATQCSTTEDDWYRMAVHHTAGPQTSGGSVGNVLTALQAYEQDSGEYCDLPYQFMVGFDGSVYEGRPLTLYSGATGGGNNDGNLAVCFVGCYHPAAECPNNDGHEVTAEMMAGAHLLIQTLVRIHDIVSDDNTIRGHRDWPGNSTACPGNFVYPRLGELRADMTWYTAAETARSFPAGAEPLEVTAGEPAELWVEMVNNGGVTWQPGTTFLAPTPRDVASPLADASWSSPTRAASVAAPVAPGQTGRFTFKVLAAEAGDLEQTFGLVQEGVSWFGDAPWGGGPGDDAITVRLHATAGGGGDGGDEGDTGDGDGDGAGDGADGDGADDVDGGCSTGGSTGGTGALALGLLMMLGGARRRRRPRS